jgi:hypothetical protein
MPGSSSTSFIPKHTPNKPERRSSPRQVFFGTLLVRILFISVLIAALGVFLYLRKLDNELRVEIDNFTNVASSYEADKEKLNAILLMDERLVLANKLLKQSVSLNALLSALERSVIGTVQLSSFAFVQLDPDTLNLSVSVQTDSFDSTIFQRSIFEENEVLGMAEIEDVAVFIPTESDLGREEGVTFNTFIEIDPALIPAVVITDEIFPKIPEPEPVEGENETQNLPVGDGTSEDVTAEPVESSVDIGLSN